MCLLLPGFLEKEVAVAPAVFLAEAFVDDLQPGRAEPADDPVAAWIVAVTSDVAFDDLPAYRRKPATVSVANASSITGWGTSSTVR